MAVAVGGTGPAAPGPASRPENIDGVSSTLPEAG